MRRMSEELLEQLAGCWGEGGPDLRARPGKLYKGGGSTTSTNTNINYSPEEAAKRAQVMDEASRVYNATAGTISNADYPGAKVAGFSPETQVAQQLAVANAASAQNSINQINQGVQYGMSGAMDVNNNPYLQQAIQAATRANNQNFSDAGGTLSQIRTGAENAGQYGGSRQGIAEGLAASRLAQTNADVAATMSSAAYDKGQDTFAKTLMFAPQALEAGMTPVNWLSSVGAQKENYQQQLNDYDANAAMWKLNAPWVPLQNYASIVFGGASPGTTSTSSQTQGSRSALGTAAQAAGTGLTAYTLAQQMMM